MRTIGALLGLFGLIASVWTQGTAFTYQGYLRQSGNPVNANHDFQFSLWTAVSGGSQVGATQTLTNVPVQNGLFTVSLDFGAVWDGSDRYLQIAVRPSGSGSYTTLSPRVKINPTPYAIRAGIASPIGAAGGDLSGSYPNPTVARLQGRSVSNAAPSSGQVLKWNGSAWTPAADDVGGLTLPFSGSANVPGAAFQVTNTAASGLTYGVYGLSASTSGWGVFGEASATSGFTYGVHGRSASPDGRGVYGEATAATGVNWGAYGLSRSASGTGVAGLATATSGTNYGGWFESSSNAGFGVHAWARATSGVNYGIKAITSSAAGWAGYFEGRVFVNGAFSASGAKAFQIDHPLNPETHYLNHFCAEGPEPYNLYRGNVTTDAQGYAVVQLPDYFEAVNRDPTYHLTVIDGSDDFILAKVVREIQNNRFVIRTSKPFVKVSWEVKAVRNDPWVQRYGYQTEQEKEDNFKGKYLNPELYGQPKERGVHQHPEPAPAPTEQAKP